jgi:hypothetical protein
MKARLSHLATQAEFMVSSSLVPSIPSGQFTIKFILSDLKM